MKRKKDYRLGWEKLTDGIDNPVGIRKLKDENEYKIHKMITKDMIGNIEQYAHIYYVDTFAPYIIHKNRYPYRLKDNIRHYILWCSPKSVITRMTALKIAQMRFPNRRIIVQQNDIKKRSIKSLKHYHIFVEISR